MKSFIFLLLLFLISCKDNVSEKKQTVLSITNFESLKKIDTYKYILVAKDEINFKSEYGIDKLLKEIPALYKPISDKLLSARKVTKEIELSSDNEDYLLLILIDSDVYDIYELRAGTRAINLKDINYLSQSGEVKSNFINVLDDISQSMTFSNNSYSNLSFVMTKDLSPEITFNNITFRNFAFLSNSKNFNITFDGVTVNKYYSIFQKSTIKLKKKNSISELMVFSQVENFPLFIVTNSELTLEKGLVYQTKSFVGGSEYTLNFKELLFYKNLEKIVKATGVNNNLSKITVNQSAFIDNSICFYLSDVDFSIDKSAFYNNNVVLNYTDNKTSITNTHIVGSGTDQLLHMRYYGYSDMARLININKCNIIFNTTGYLIEVQSDQYGHDININNSFFNIESSQISNRVFLRNTKLLIENISNTQLIDSIGI